MALQRPIKAILEMLGNPNEGPLKEFMPRHFVLEIVSAPFREPDEMLRRG